MRVSLGTSVLVAAIACGSRAVAQDSSAHGLMLFDRPTSKQVVLSRGDNEPIGEARCTYYPDIVIRETGTDSPTPNAASTSRVTDVACDASMATSGSILETRNYSFLGRKGPFLFFGLANPNGVVPFMVIAAASGQILYRDGKVDPGFRSISVEGDKAHILFKRGFNASCSILQDGASCWTKLMGEGRIPRIMAQSQPPIQACAASYNEMQAPASAPTMVVYDVDMTLEVAGKVRVISRGPVSCLAIP